MISIQHEHFFCVTTLPVFTIKQYTWRSLQAISTHSHPRESDATGLSDAARISRLHTRCPLAAVPWCASRGNIVRLEIMVLFEKQYKICIRSPEWWWWSNPDVCKPADCCSLCFARSSFAFYFHFCSMVQCGTEKYRVHRALQPNTVLCLTYDTGSI